MLKHILLGFLNIRPMTGYELKTVMDESTMHFWHAYHSQIYTTLRKLEEEGLVESEVEDGDDKLNRRVYTLTDAGRADLQGWLDTPLAGIVPVKEDLLVRIFFSAGRDRQAVIDELRFQRQLHQRTLDEYRRLQSGSLTEFAGDDTETLAPHLPFWRATLRFGIAYEEHYLHWLDETLQMIAALE